MTEVVYAMGCGSGGQHQDAGGRLPLCLTDIGGLEEYGTVRRQFLTGTPPTSMTFEVPRLFRPEAQIEIEVEVVAAVSPRPAS